MLFYVGRMCLGLIHIHNCATKDQKVHCDGATCGENSTVFLGQITFHNMSCGRILWPLWEPHGLWKNTATLVRTKDGGCQGIMVWTSGPALGSQTVIPWQQRFTLYWPQHHCVDLKCGWWFDEMTLFSTQVFILLLLELMLLLRLKSLVQQMKMHWLLLLFCMSTFYLLEIACMTSTQIGGDFCLASIRIQFWSSSVSMVPIPASSQFHTNSSAFIHHNIQKNTSHLLSTRFM